MPKTFYTERDIEDLVARGVKSLIVDDDVVLTDLAYDKAGRLGLELLRQNDQPPAAPVRPYIAKSMAPPTQKTQPVPEVAPQPAQKQELPTAGSGSDLHQRVYQAALARLGDAVDPKLLDTIVGRVLKSIETK